jgi:hypothetical protein
MLWVDYRIGALRISPLDVPYITINGKVRVKVARDELLVVGCQYTMDDQPTTGNYFRLRFLLLPDLGWPVFAAGVATAVDRAGTLPPPPGMYWRAFWVFWNFAISLG